MNRIDEVLASAYNAFRARNGAFERSPRAKAINDARSELAELLEDRDSLRFALETSNEALTAARSHINKQAAELAALRAAALARVQP